MTNKISEGKKNTISSDEVACVKENTKKTKPHEFSVKKIRKRNQNKFLLLWPRFICLIILQFSTGCCYIAYRKILKENRINANNK